MRIRVKYNVTGKIRFISHLDLMRAFNRACIKKDIPVQVSQGFSPRLLMSFGPPLNVGMTSSDEYLDMYTARPFNKNSLQEGLPGGIVIEEIYEVPKDLPSLCASLNRAVYRIKISPDKTTDIVEINNGELIIDMPIGNPIKVLVEIWPDVGLDELKLWRIHREKLYNERDFN